MTHLPQLTIPLNGIPTEAVGMQAGTLNQIPIELIKEIFCGLDRRSLANVSEINRSLNQWVFKEQTRAKSLEAEEMVALLIAFFAGQEETCSLCRNLLDGAKILNCISLFDLAQNLKQLKFKLANLFLFANKQEIKRLDHFLAEHPLPDSFSDFLETIDFLKRIKREMEGLGALSFYRLLGVKNFVHFFKEDNPLELFQLLLALPEFENPYLIWHTFQLAASTDPLLTKKILDFAIKKHERPEPDFYAALTTLFVQEPRSSPEVLLAEAKQKILCSFFKFHLHLARCKARQALSIAKDLISYLEAFSITFLNDSFYQRYDYCYYICQKLLQKGYYNEAIEFCQRESATRGPYNETLLASIFWDVHLALKESDVKEFLRVMHFFDWEDVSLNSCYAKKAHELASCGQIKEALRVAANFSYDPEVLKRHDARDLSLIVEGLLSQDAVAEAYEVFSWQFRKGLSYITIHPGFFALTLKLIDRGDRAKLHQILEALPEEEKYLFGESVRTQEIRTILEHILKNSPGKKNLLEGVFIANHLQSEGTRGLYHHRLLEKLKEQCDLAELEEAEKMKNVLWQDAPVSSTCCVS